MTARPSDDKGQQEQSNIRRYLRLSTIGIELGLEVIIGLIGGQWLDKTFGTAPWLLLAGLLVGLAAGVRTIYRALKSLNPPSTGSKPKSGEPGH